MFRVIETIKNTLEEKEYFSAVFIDVKHDGPIAKKTCSPSKLFQIFKSYCHQSKNPNFVHKICGTTRPFPYINDIPTNENMTIVRSAIDIMITEKHDDS